MSNIFLAIGVGSTNPVKIQAVEDAVRFVLQQRAVQIAPEFQGFSVESGVSAQPFSDEETVTGARNRAQAVLDAAAQIEIAIGLEGGVFEDSVSQIWSTVWVCVLDREGHERVVNGMRFLLPPEIQAGLRTGKELGDVMNELTQQTNVKHNEGMIGILTGGAIPRTIEYSNLARLAFALWWQEFGASVLVYDDSVSVFSQ
jgi:inosine/xanthosine triphosphatase